MIDIFAVIIIGLMFVLAACGEDSYETVHQPAPTQPTDPTPSPAKPIDPTGKDPKAIAVQAIQDHCVSCHNGVVQAPSFKEATAIDANHDRICIRVGNGSMPPTGNLPKDAKDEILKGLDC